MLYKTTEPRVASTGDKVLYVFHDFETPRNTENTDKAKLNVPNLVCVQQFCSRVEDEEGVDCV